jgi:oligopeptide/dipeptide ABC transporter ATP-binding protein
VDVTEPTDLEPLVPGTGGGAGAPVLAVRNLRVEFPTDDGVVKAVDDLTFDLSRNEVLGIVGESGSGKSVTSMAILGLLPRSARVSGEVWFEGEQILGAPEKRIQPIRGNRIAMVFQDALASLNPVYTVGDQIAEAITVHDGSIGKKEVRDKVVSMLDLVGIPNPKDRADQYPHEFSGGMRQRAMIAMSIANDPDVLIADEPTTALDVTIQAQVLEVLERIQDRTNSAIILITHDLGVVAGVADRVLVMYAARQVELGTVDDVFYRPRHPYTMGLLASLPRIDRTGGDGRLYRIAGQPPSLIHIPDGCRFHPRCFNRELPAPCGTERPALLPTDGDPGHVAACHFSERLVGLSPDELRNEMAQ